MLTQEALLHRVRPLLERHGGLYQKKARVFARLARAGESVDTVTSDGLETTNVASSDAMMLVQNQTTAGERYLVPAGLFARRYRHLRAISDGWAEYESVGRIRAVELTSELLEQLGLPAEFEFSAPWGSPMVARQGDFLAGPEPLSEVYRIARAEFEETYALVE